MRALVLAIGLGFMPFAACSRPTVDIPHGPPSAPLALAEPVAPVLGDSPDPPRDAIPVVVELFSSEGCSSCPRAEAALGEILAQPPPGTRVVALEFHVNYWDYLGHTDSFAEASYTERQQMYATQLKSSLYTPQAVVDGQTQLVGSRKSDLRATVAAAAKRPHVALTIVKIVGKPALETETPLAIQVGRLPTGIARAQLMLAEIERHQATHVARGENSGATLQHTWVVRRLSDLGEIGANGATVSAPHVVVRGEHGVVALLANRETHAIIGSEVFGMADH